MNPSEKAVSLVDYFMPIVKDLEVAKKCAVKVCKEIIDAKPTGDSLSYDCDCFDDIVTESVEYFVKVIGRINLIKPD